MSTVSNPLRCLWPLALALSIAGCGGEPAPAGVRPALVVQASSGELGYEAFSGEVHAREEPQLAFRIAGKISRRLVDAGRLLQPGCRRLGVESSAVPCLGRGRLCGIDGTFVLEAARSLVVGAALAARRRAGDLVGLGDL